ncbi:MAG: type 4a pilus biogenesis protein PilO [Candidatus Omnitrophica bacterium]|nr:type 4a pilus biogenesis protein PilO [Candidatus Omnitrophota bacterium]
MDSIELLNKYKNMVVSAVVLLIALSISVNIYKDQSRKTTELAAKKELEAKKNTTLQDINSYEKQLEAYKGILNKKAVDSIINTLGDLAKESSVTIEAVKPQEEKPYGTFRMLQFEINVSSSSYHNIAKFINKIESYPDIFMITWLSLHVDLVQEGDQQINKLKADMRLNTFKISD